MYRRVDTVCGETQQSYFSRWLRTEIAASLQMWRKAKSVFINPHIRLPYVPLRDRYLTFVPHCFSAAPLKGVEEEIVQYHHGNCTDDSAGLHLQGCLSECVSVCCFVCVWKRESEWTSMWNSTVTAFVSTWCPNAFCSRKLEISAELFSSHRYWKKLLLNPCSCLC